MKLKIWTEENAKNCANDQLFVRLIKHEKCDDIILYLVDKTGEPTKDPHLLVIEQDLKCLILFDDVNQNIPLKTDIDGMLMFLTEREYKEKRREEMHEHMLHHITICNQKDETAAVKH